MSHSLRANRLVHPVLPLADLKSKAPQLLADRPVWRSLFSINRKCLKKIWIMTEADALKWVAEIFEESPERIRPEVSRNEIASWDSLGVLSLMAGLNQTFEIVLSNEEIAGMQSVGDILGVLKRNGKLNGSL
jgi:acyl carrier protein